MWFDSSEIQCEELEGFEDYEARQEDVQEEP